ncbi:hypothetical protein [Puniceibacterium sp. IMCC21224]|uniref:hypothetical protein n=1 Tax=Puniceibacterium sp. IMCC21224 TaxID=1618204 RepID=UPI00064D90D0|nr:hypothetical protein [Puniceibacterium sp. IMCC21224]KMK65074.1 hypothetical protein IMCC21224_12319 [Puniceibacterium sp. IMCC21224]
MEKVVPQVIEIDGGVDDAALTGALRKASRDAVCLMIAGNLSANLGGPAGWVPLLADTPVLLSISVEGPVGTRGIALILLADIVVMGANPTCDGTDIPALAELAALRLGALNARRVLLATDPLSELVAIGHATRAEAPRDAARSRAAAFAPVAHRLRQGWRAARDLPAGEALAYAAWFNSITNKEAS